MFRGHARSACAVLFLLVVLAGVIARFGSTGPDEEVRGPEWRTGPRTGVGAATSASPAELAGIDVEEHGGFDRILISFDGPLPGYRVGYGRPASPAGTDVLTIVLQHVWAAGGRLLDFGLPAVVQVRRAPSSGGNARTAVMVRSGARLPFRIGISLGALYVDVAHPGEVV